MPVFALPARRRDRRSKPARLTRLLAAVGTSAAVLALPVLGATSASAATPASVATKPAAATTVTTRAGSLDSWIRQSLVIMKRHGIPGSYYGIYRNVMRESSGNPFAINLWDSNARMGIPSKGLLQVIAPTFRSYHVPGTSWNIYDPVANITAACNYAAHRYGSIDHVNSAY